MAGWYEFRELGSFLASMILISSFYPSSRIILETRIQYLVDRYEFQQTRATIDLDTLSILKVGHNVE